MNHTSNQAHSVFAVENIYKMFENCVKVECAGCRKLIPTHLFYDHMNSNQCGLLQREKADDRNQSLLNYLQKSGEGIRNYNPTAVPSASMALSGFNNGNQPK
jgi:hypothetical protein